MALSQSFLTSASGGVPGLTRSFLTHAAGSGGTLVSRSYLIRAHGSAAGASSIDAGQAQLLEPFTPCTIRGVVVTPDGGSALTWTFLPQAPWSAIPFTQNGYSITFDTPATVAGTVVTFLVTAHFSGYPDASDSVSVTVRPHAEWMPITPTLFIPVYDQWVTATGTGSLGGAALGAFDLGGGT